LCYDAKEVREEPTTRKKFIDNRDVNGASKKVGTHKHVFIVIKSKITFGCSHKMSVEGHSSPEKGPFKTASAAD
jgi:hypothetical protein